MSSSAMLRRKYDAVIVGARCAGAATAMLLARSGLTVLAVDRQDYGTDTLSTHALMRAGVLQLARWGILDKIADAGTPPVRHTTFYYGDDAVAIDIRPDHGVEALYAPRRTVIDRALVDAARGAGAEIRHGAILTAISRAPTGEVAAVSIRDSDGTEQQVRTPLVIGADGRHSTVARLVCAQDLRFSAHRAATVYGYVNGLADLGYRWYFGPGVSAGVVPTNDGNSCVFVSLPPEGFRREMSNGGEALYQRILAETSPNLAAEVAGAARQGRLRGFPGEAGFVRRSHGPGWALVGDAGYFKDPATAHGITDALRDAELLAEAAVDGSRSAFEHYQGERDALSNELFAVTDEIASFEWSYDSLKEMHIRLNRAMKDETAALAEREPIAGGADKPTNRERDDDGTQSGHGLRRYRLESDDRRSAGSGPSGRAEPDDVHAGRRNVHVDDGRREPAAL